MKEKAIINTSEGDLTFEFWTDVAPKTVENFRKLSQEGFFNGTSFHRIVKGFMVQGGDPLTKDASKQHLWGTGGPGYCIDAEFNERPHVKGVISMARSQNPNSAGSQFFVCLEEARFLDRQYTGFGQLIDGFDVLEKIGQTPVVMSNSGEQSKPTQTVEIIDVEWTSLE